MSTMLTSNKNRGGLLLKDPDIPVWAYGFVIYIASLFFSGYYVFVANHCLQIPLVYWLNDHSIYPNDPFAATLPYYASMLWRVVAWLARLISLKPLLFILFLLERAFVLYAAAGLASTIAPKSKLAPVAAMILFALIPKPILGNGTIVQIYFEQTGMSIPFILLAMAAFYKNRQYLWAIWLALAFNMNSLYGAHAVVYFGAVMMVYPLYRREWKKWLAAIGLFVVVASPAIFYTAQAFIRESSDSDLWIIANQVRSLHHLFPLFWDKRVFLKFFTLLFIVIAVIWQKKGEQKQLYKIGIVWAGVSVLWLLYAFIGTAVFESPSMVIMQPARATDFWYAFAGITLISLCAIDLEKGVQLRRFLTIILLACIFFWNPVILPYILIGLIFLLWEPLWKYVLLEGSPKRLSLVLVTIFFFLSLNTARDRVLSGGGGYVFVPPDRQVTELGDWAKESTKKDAVFLVNPGTMWGNFRLLSKRPVYVTWKDGSALLWDRSYTDIWIERLQDLGYDITRGRDMRSNRDEKLDDVYNSLTDDFIVDMKLKYKLDYWVVELDHQSSYPVVYKTGKFKVLEIR
ncbi:hypothetical protein JXQ31_11670 [candidate division KSB1 bacterium]|nr:hypothetical protein [candidate division KSB1 bacterium]